MTSPKPRQFGHGREVTTWPRNERCTLCTSPRPWQMSHMAGRVPGAQPEPLHSEHSTAVSTARSRCTPLAHSSSVSCIRISASAPGWTRLRGPRPRPPAPWPPKNASMMSPKPNALNGSPAPPAAPRPLPSGSPPRSTMRRFSGSDSTSYAALTSREPLLSRRVGIDVRVQLAGQPPVGPLDLVGPGVGRDPEDPVVVPCHVSVPHALSVVVVRSACVAGGLRAFSARPGSHPRTAPPHAPPRSSPDSPSGSARRRPCLPTPCAFRNRSRAPRCRASPRPRSPRRCAR